jgi:hypothetical protein
MFEKRKRKLGTVSDLLRVSFRWTRGSHGSHEMMGIDWEWSNGRVLRTRRTLSILEGHVFFGRGVPEHEDV